MKRYLFMNEADALRSTYEHIGLVQKLLASAQVELMRRQFTHDRSKLAEPEWSMFAEVTGRLAGMTYGSVEYKECLAEMLDGPLGHHYEHNRHHPEHYPEKGPSPDLSRHLETLDYFEEYVIKSEMSPDEFQRWEKLKGLIIKLQRQHTAQVNGMTLFDLIEMFIDWAAAVKRHDDGDIYRSIEINKDRFNLSPQLTQILENTVLWVKDEFEGLATQKDLNSHPKDE